MIMLKYEIKKNYFNLTILFFLAVCTLLEIYKIGEYHSKNFSNAEIFGETAYNETFQKYGGRITAEKANEVSNIALTIRNLITSGGYDEENDSGEYITGSIYLDNIMMNSAFYNPMKYSYEYKAYSNDITEKAVHNIEFFESKGNTYETKRNRLISEVYGGRYISELYDNQGYEKYLGFEFTAVTVCFMLIVGIAPVFSGEKGVGMQNLIYSCYGGRSRIFAAKLGSVFLYTLFIFLWFMTTDLIAFGSIYGFQSGNAPVYSLEMLKNIPINCSLVQFMIIVQLYRLIGYLVFAFIIMAISAFFSQTAVSGIVSALTTILLLFGESLDLGAIEGISPVRVISSAMLFSEFKTINILDTPVPLHIFLASAFVVSLIFMIFISGAVYNLEGKGIASAGKKQKGEVGA